MTLPLEYQNTHFPVKYFLASYRALSDGRSGIRHLEECLESNSFLVSDWKVVWIGSCTLLRSAIDLFQIDSRSCINQSIRTELHAEWEAIASNREEHSIFWDFLRKERNNILHEYEWNAYEAWMTSDGAAQPARISLLNLRPDDADSVLIMRDGPYKDQNSLNLLIEGADWVEERIYSAIRRAGFDPDEYRSLINFTPLPPSPPGLLGLFSE